MTQGALIFAQSNPSIDYIKLAVFAAERVKKYLNIPVAIATDNPDYLVTNFPNHPFDDIVTLQVDSVTQQRLFYDGSLVSKTLAWNNTTRNQAYELSPYDTTLVLDSDYILNSSILKCAFDIDYDFQIYRNSFNVAEWKGSSEFKRINQYSIPFYWATVFIFKKTTVTKAFFDLIVYIKQNWQYFRTLYNIDAPTFRNDFAFSIAIHIMNGKTNGEFAIELPGTMSFSTDRDVLVSIDDNKVKLLLAKSDNIGEYIAAKTTGLDLHIMNKQSLNRFIDGGSGV